MGDATQEKVHTELWCRHRGIGLIVLLVFGDSGCIFGHFCALRRALPSLGNNFNFVEIVGHFALYKAKMSAQDQEQTAIRSESRNSEGNVSVSRAGTSAEATPPQIRAARLLESGAIASSSTSSRDNNADFTLPPLSPDPVRRQLFASSPRRSEHDSKTAANPNTLAASSSSVPSTQSAPKVPTPAQARGRRSNSSPPLRTPRKTAPANKAKPVPVTPKDATPKRFRSRSLYGQPQMWEKTRMHYARVHGLEYRDKDGACIRGDAIFVPLFL